MSLFFKFIYLRNNILIHCCVFLITLFLIHKQYYFSATSIQKYTPQNHKFQNLETTPTVKNRLKCNKHYNTSKNTTPTHHNMRIIYIILML